MGHGSDRETENDRGGEMRRLVIFAALVVMACSKRYEEGETKAVTGGGDSNRGKQLIQQYGCQSCHSIPGVTGPKGAVGPPLAKMAERSFIGGKVQNTPQNMITWLQNPQAFDPGNAMPNLGVTPKDARDITAFLLTLK
jgi:cytochrome c